MASKAKEPASPTVLYLAEAGADPQKAIVLDHEGTVGGYETLNLKVGKDIHEGVAPELGGPNDASARWRLDES